jgi:hypothetical protein
MAGVVVQQEDFVKALDQLQAAHSDTIGAPKVSPWTVTSISFRYNWGS